LPNCWQSGNQAIGTGKGGSGKTTTTLNLAVPGLVVLVALLLPGVAAIDAWRQNMGLAQRLQLNHPNAVWRKPRLTRRVSNTKS
jgi:CO dehydrogenase nickel-insertion accessory protein CooC1